MSKKYLFSFFVLITVYSCGKKHIPEKTAETPVTNTVSTTKKSDSIVVKKRNFTPKKKDIIPPSIVVNDKAAKKAVDGRLYYDLLGHRYWKNYKDGKYYLFNQRCMIILHLNLLNKKTFSVRFSLFNINHFKIEL